MKHSMNDEKNTDDAIQLLAGAYGAFERVSNPRKRMVILGIAKKSVDDMLVKFCVENPGFSLGEFVALLGAGGNPVAQEPQEQVGPLHEQ